MPGIVLGKTTNKSSNKHIKSGSYKSHDDKAG